MGPPGPQGAQGLPGTPGADGADVTAAGLTLRTVGPVTVADNSGLFAPALCLPNEVALSGGHWFVGPDDGVLLESHVADISAAPDRPGVDSYVIRFNNPVGGASIEVTIYVLCLSTV